MLTSFEDRIVDAFGGRTLKEVAERLDVNYHTLRNWAKETRDIPPAELKKIAILTNVSLNWLLLGEGEKFANQRKEFNLERSIERHHAWRPVLEEWFEFEGKEMPEFEHKGFQSVRAVANHTRLMVPQLVGGTRNGW